MKKLFLIIFIAVLIVLIVCLLSKFGIKTILNLIHKPTAAPYVEVTDFESFSYSNTNYMSMEDTYEYTITNNGGAYSLKITSFVYDDDESFVTEIPLTEVAALIDAMNNCKVTTWDGFDEVDKYVLDGGGFSMGLTLPDGKRISVHGSNAYPNDFGSFHSTVSSLFDKYRIQYNYDRLPKTLESDNISSIFANFKQDGTSEHSEYKFHFMKELFEDRNNVEAMIFDQTGEFVKAMNSSSDTYSGNFKKANLDFSNIQSIVREYDLPALNGYDKAADDYANEEWFQIEISYDSGEHISFYGTKKPEHYDEFRNALISECIAIVRQCTNDDF